MNLRFPHAHLPALARTRRRGFIAAVETVGRVESGIVIIASADWHRLTLQYLKRPTRLGDMVAKVAKPVARAVDWGSAKLPARYHTHLVTCRSCQARQSGLNAADARFRGWWRGLFRRLLSWR